MLAKRYEDFYGNQASIRFDGLCWVLTMWNPNGLWKTKKEYKTELGAKIAMGKASDGWKAKGRD